MKVYKLIIALGIGVLLPSSLLLVNAAPSEALDEHQCLSCHNMTPLTKTTEDGKRVSLYVDEKAVNMGAHRYLDCTTCHTSQPHKVDTPLTKLSLAEKCGSCHQYEYKQHLDSIHGQQLVKGNADVATCVDCHSANGSPHNIIRTLEYNAPTYKKNIAETCANCHNNEKLMGNYGIVEKVYESYMRSYHGKSLTLSSDEITQLGAATCTNCHGAHNIKPVNDPNSYVGGMDNLVNTCRQCHPQAGMEFVKGFLGHKEASTAHVPAAYYVEKSFGYLLYVVLGFGALVLVGAIFSYSRRRWRN